MLDYLRIMLNARLAKMDERGASAVEYGLLIAGIAALIVVVVFAFGGVIKGIFQKTCNSIGTSSGGGSCCPRHHHSLTFVAADLRVRGHRHVRGREGLRSGGPRASAGHLRLVLPGHRIPVERGIRSGPLRRDTGSAAPQNHQGAP